jgi:PAS domain S-box-containing protein
MARILLVDDDPDIVDLLKLGLETEGYEVLEAGSGGECLEKLNAKKPDLILLDIMMPDMGGLDVLKAVKKASPNTGVIMITAHATLERAVNSLKHGAYDFICKPYESDELLASIARCLEKQRLEQELREIRDFLSNVIESSMDLIITADLDGSITTFNRGAEDLLGYKAEDMLGASVLDLYPEGLREWRIKLVEKLKNGEKIRTLRTKVYNSKGELVDISLSLSLLMDGEGNPIGTVSVARDISKEVKAEEEMMRRVLKYKIKDGSIYLVLERRPHRALEVFLDLVKCGFNGAVITRAPSEEIRNPNVDAPILWLSEGNHGEAFVRPGIGEVEKVIKDLLVMNKVVLLDRLDYLVVKNGFRKVLDFIQRLNEKIYLEKKILLLSMDPRTLKTRELSLLEKETRKIMPKREPDFPEDLYEIFKYVYQQNNLGIKPAYTEVTKEIKVTRTTARKRIRELVSRGLIVDKRKGRLKVLELTDAGLDYF